MDFETLDQETSRLPVQLQLDDIQAIQDETPDQAGDLSAAIDLYRAELQTFADTIGEGMAEPPEMADCICCASHVPGAMVPAPCGHCYRGQCISTLLDKATADESLFPPRCCRLEITMDMMVPFLTSHQMNLYEAKRVEFRTADRTYCHRTTCSAFIPPSASGETTVTCATCLKTTCTVCKGPGHKGDCPREASTKEALRLAADNGWQQCSNRSRVIELNHGRNPITCLCKAESCYLCAKEWKNCDCPQWNDENLLARARNLVDRDVDHADAPERNEAYGLPEARRSLLERHGCDHRVWDFQPGRYACEECSSALPSYVYQCRRCRILACRRCRFDRL